MDWTSMAVKRVMQYIDESGIAAVTSYWPTRTAALEHGVCHVSSARETVVIEI